jgi:NitT/TauT family transport system permease protein
MPVAVYTTKDLRSQPRFGWRDVAIFLALFAVLYGLLHVFHQASVPTSPNVETRIGLSPAALPGYAFRSLVRMFAAFCASIVFTLVYGYTAAYNKRAEKVMVPLLDILQSVPVLGFLSVTVTAFMALFPHSLLGLECASVFAIFTGQAWNMTFSFYHSLKILPRELTEAAIIYRLTWWQRFVKLEVPFSMIGLVWNGMMSFGGGWFFLAASEAITVLGKNLTLPGIGSYMALAVQRGDTHAILWAIATMILIVVLVDQLFWRPVVAWSQRFKFEQSESGDEPESAVLDLLRGSAMIQWLERRVFTPAARRLDRALGHATELGRGARAAARVFAAVRTVIGAAFALGAAYLAVRAALGIGSDFQWRLVVKVWGLGLLTLCRVLVVVVISTVIWTPIGVRIGFSPKLAKVAQPLVQIGASFPANLVFPLVVLAFVRFHIDLNWGSVLLLMLGTQWYILFNVIAGATSVPGDLREAALVFRLRGWTLWRRLILPAIFPAWVTGALTAAGGAWNASIVAEVADYGSHHMVARGLGAFIAESTTAGNWAAIVISIATMSVFVVMLNRCVWKPLYQLAEDRYRLG